MSGYCLHPDCEPYEECVLSQPGDICEVDGETGDTYGGEHYWHCGNPGSITVDSTLMCEDHAGERGYGPKQEEYGYDPDDGLNPEPAKEAAT